MHGCLPQTTGHNDNATLHHSFMSTQTRMPTLVWTQYISSKHTTSFSLSPYKPSHSTTDSIEIVASSLVHVSTAKCVASFILTRYLRYLQLALLAKFATYVLPSMITIEPWSCRAPFSSSIHHQATTPSLPPYRFVSSIRWCLINEFLVAEPSRYLGDRDSTLESVSARCRHSDLA